MLLQLPTPEIPSPSGRVWQDLTVTLTRGELVIDKNLIIDADLDNDQEPDITLTISTESRVIFIDDALLVTLDGSIIIGGNPPSFNTPGAGIYISSGGITSIKNSIINENGVWREQWNQTGGGIYNNGTLYLENCLLASNKAYAGGAIYNNYIAILSNTQLNFNQAKDNGGAIYSAPGSTLNIGTSRLSLNKISRYPGDPEQNNGGAIYNWGTLTVHDSFLGGNGIKVCPEPPETDCIIAGAGGGVYNNKVKPPFTEQPLIPTMPQMVGVFLTLVCLQLKTLRFLTIPPTLAVDLTTTVLNLRMGWIFSTVLFPVTKQMKTVAAEFT